MGSMPLRKGADGELTRRDFVRSAGAAGLILATPMIWLQPDTVGTPDPEQIHLQFGSDASREVTVSWVTPVDVQTPQVRLSLANGESGRVVDADTRPYIDGASKVEVLTHHATLTDLEPATAYTYAVMHAG